MDTSKVISRIQYGNVEIPIKTLNLQEKTATKNGPVTPDPEFGGLSRVIVDVKDTGPLPDQFFVKVIDYDGTLIDEAWLNNGDEYTPPNPPNHDRLIFQEWSTSQAFVDGKIIIDNNDVMIGAVYTTKSGLCEFDIEITKAMVEDIETNGYTVTLNMDGNKWWLFDRDKTTSDTETTHTFYEYGTYTIACDGTTMSTSSATNTLIYATADGNRHLYIRGFIVNVQNIPSYSHYGHTCLQTITIDNKTTTISNYNFNECAALVAFISPPAIVSMWNSFSACYTLESIVLPHNAYAMHTMANTTASLLYNCVNLKNVALSNGITILGASTFSGCISLTRCTLPDSVSILRNFALNGIGVRDLILKVRAVDQSALKISYLKKVTFINTQTIGESAVYGVNYLEKVKFSKEINKIYQSCFSSTRVPVVFDFSDAEQIPTIYSQSFGNPTSLLKTCKIVVPDALYDEWIVATNWAGYADFIYKASEVQL